MEKLNNLMCAVMTRGADVDLHAVESEEPSSPSKKKRGAFS